MKIRPPKNQKEVEATLAHLKGVLEACRSDNSEAGRMRLSRSIAEDLQLIARLEQRVERQRERLADTQAAYEVAQANYARYKQIAEAFADPEFQELMKLQERIRKEEESS